MCIWACLGTIHLSWACTLEIPDAVASFFFFGFSFSFFLWAVEKESAHRGCKRLMSI